MGSSKISAFFVQTIGLIDSGWGLSSWVFEYFRFFLAQKFCRGNGNLTAFIFYPFEMLCLFLLIFLFVVIKRWKLYIFCWFVKKLQNPTWDMIKIEAITQNQHLNTIVLTTMCGDILSVLDVGWLMVKKMVCCL